MVFNTKCEIFIFLVIVLNSLIMVLPFEGASDSFNNIIDILNDIFTCIFAIEALLKIVAHVRSKALLQRKLE